MGRNLRAALLTILLLGCGGRSTDSAPAGFINQTQHTDAELWAIWSAAQQSIAETINLNPVQQTLSGASPEVLPGDPRAMSIMPQQLTITPEPDVSSAVLFAATGLHRGNPTGMIACPQPCNVRYSTAYSRYGPEITCYAASWEWTSSFNALIEYEFENQILFALGYDMTWR
ncbi:MAG TPA: hypothetical protein VMB18_06470 [Terriglobales bacterium]|nr:hypothetical protein [Terriglobales bacterium]